MNPFQNLHLRAKYLTEGKQSPYTFAHPKFSGITSHMRSKGLSSAPLDTIKFIRETLYFLDIIDDNELMAIKRGAGFTGKKQALLKTLKDKQSAINEKKDEIADRIANTLDDFISGVGVNRGREEEYAARAVAKEITKEIRQVGSGKEMDDALSDIVTSEKILVKASIAKILHAIRAELGEPGFDIDEEALEEVINYSVNINTLADLKSFISQIANEPGYEKIAAYLSAAVKPIAAGGAQGMIEDEEHEDDSEDYYDPSARHGYGGAEDEAEVDEVMSGEDEDEDEESADKRTKVTESYTNNYMTGLPHKYSKLSEAQEQGQSFKERMKPKTYWQLLETRRYGL